MYWATVCIWLRYTLYAPFKDIGCGTHNDNNISKYEWWKFNVLLFHHISRNKDNIFMYIHKYASWIRYCSRSDMYTFAYVYANTQSGYLIKLCHSHVNEIKHLQIDLKNFPPWLILIRCQDVGWLMTMVMFILVAHYTSILPTRSYEVFFNLIEWITILNFSPHRSWEYF